MRTMGSNQVQLTGKEKPNCKVEKKNVFKLKTLYTHRKLERNIKKLKKIYICNFKKLYQKT